MKHLLLIAFVLTLLLPGAPVQAGSNKTCKRIPHGVICYVNGVRYSLSCDDGLMVWPRGSGWKCIPARP